MKKLAISTVTILLLQSCVVSTATKAVKGVTNIGYQAVKGTVNGIGWAVSKANGKIDEDRLDGRWKLVGVYHGDFETFQRDSNPNTTFSSDCTPGFDQMIFKTKKSKLKPMHCSSDNENWTKYSFNFGKNPSTKAKENYFSYIPNSYISIIDVNNKTMLLEGNLVPKMAFSGAKLYLLEKIK